MAQGTIARLAGHGYGFGFIKDGAGTDVYFHGTALEDVALDALRVGDRVEFDIEPLQQRLGDQAVHVRRVAAQAH